MAAMARRDRTEIAERLQLTEPGKWWMDAQTGALPIVIGEMAHAFTRDFHRDQIPMSRLEQCLKPQAPYRQGVRSQTGAHGDGLELGPRQESSRLEGEAD